MLCLLKEQIARPTLILASKSAPSSALELLQAPFSRDDSVLEDAEDRATLTPSRDRPTPSDPRSSMTTTTSPTRDSSVRPSVPAHGAPIPLKILKTHLFRYDACLRRLQQLHIAEVHGAGDAARKPEEDFLRLSGVLNWEDQPMVRAIGALLAFLAESRRHLLDGRGAGILSVHSLQRFELRDFMQVDEGVFRALQVFRTDNHPSMIKGAGRTKEGFSVYSLVNHAVTTMGARLLKSWLRRPLTNLTQLRARHDALEELLALRRHTPELLKTLQHHLKGIKDLVRLLVRIKLVRHSYRDWVALRQSIQHIQGITALLSRFFQQAGRSGGSRGHEWVVLRHLLNPLERSAGESVRAVQSALDQVIDWTASDASADEAPIVCAGLDVSLDELRGLKRQLPDFLDRLADEQLSEYPALEALRVDFVPQLGCLLVVDKQANGLADATQAAASAIIPEDFVFQFETEEALSFRNSRTLEVDQYFGDLHGQVRELESSLLRQLEERVLEFEPGLVDLSHRLAEFDAWMALAEAADLQEWTRPEFVPDGTMTLIQGGRHPLQEMVVEQFIPNDTALDPAGPAGPIALLTGPNASGKSIYLKQVGVITLLAQVGSFVPAQRAVLGVVDRLFARIQTFETASAAQSAFTLDLSQVATMLRYVTPSSLILLDEFGKGTNTLDGAALLGATVQHLLNLPGRHPPRTLITTHFRELFDHRLVTGQLGDVSAAASMPSTPAPPPPLSTAVQARFYEMEVLLEEKDSELESVVPLFRVRPGIARASYGLACAQAAGMPHDVLRRAQEVTRNLREGIPIQRAPMDASFVSHDEERWLMNALAAEEDWATASDDALANLRRLCEA